MRGAVSLVFESGKAQLSSVFFFQAEDGIRDRLVTGVQTCALPICRRAIISHQNMVGGESQFITTTSTGTLYDAYEDLQIGRASCRERV